MATNGFFSAHSPQNDEHLCALDPSSILNDFSWISNPINPTETHVMVDSLSQQNHSAAKVEDSVMGLDFPKDESVDHSMDVKIPSAERSVWQESQELVNMLLGDDRSLSPAGVHLDDDLFALSNYNSQAFLFPVRMSLVFNI